ncbi:hypothetical protein TRVA0_015S02234 [Trichomonascus vanleenenianus]|uniref:2-oxo-4-hydroxy-4-carboxy-5-ureidoimidazoline decarboxylase n=1 Tax=Trichomonascus vanleenenianus TaxID=2268995 RepID=UPI003ECB8F16
MSGYELPAASTLSKLPRAEQEEALANLFEPCPTLNSIIIGEVLSSGPAVGSYPDLIEQVRVVLNNQLDTNEEDPRVSKIIAAHPRLGAPKNVKLSAHSEAEQANLKAVSEAQTKRLAELNALYEETFPGLRYVVFVNGRTRDVIMENMIERIDRKDISAERREAFNAMCDIALDRASKIKVKSQL